MYDSLCILFELVNGGSRQRAIEKEAGSDLAEGLTFNPLHADLFLPKATAHIDAVGLSNSALQKVLAHLLLSKESQGKDRGYISYAELGINQLGAVYEGLMSFTGFFAETDLYEVAKNGDASKGSWVVPTDRSDSIAAADFVKMIDERTGESKPVFHPQGSFVFRLAGRERQQSASYYTPEVLTRFTVGQALDELLDQDGHTTTAAEILEMSVCEPALGSGAFAIEAVRQLAEQYLKRRQDELKVRIDPDEYPRRLQEVKAYIALHNVYGVDLNATAVELAEISLWLDTMVEGLSAPWFGLHLRRGNSLVGARRAVYSRSQVGNKSWLSDIPKDVRLISLIEDIKSERVASDGIHHFLLPSTGWGSSEEVNEAKEVKSLYPESRRRLRAWRRTLNTKPTRKQVEALADLALRVEKLWQIAAKRLDIADSEIRRSIPVWHADELHVGGRVQRGEIEAALADTAGAYRRLRRVMDAWCALWYWPVSEAFIEDVAGQPADTVTPPDLDQWIQAMRKLVGVHAGKHRAPEDQLTFGASMSWNDLNTYEGLDLTLAGCMSIDATLRAHPWLRVCEAIAEREGFFHWTLDFAPIFISGGFDLQVGNPPWVRPRTDFEALLAESDPWWKLSERPSQAARAARLDEAWTDSRALEYATEGIATTSATIGFAGAVQNFPHLEGLQPDLYRCFMEATWRHASKRGMVGLIHLESHFTDDRAGHLREATYLRLRRHWEFINELELFDIQHQKHYGVNIYGEPRTTPRFINGVSMYHPDTAFRSLSHDGQGAEPGFKDENDRWDLRPHGRRISIVTDETLRTWHALLEEEGTPVYHSRMVYTINKSTATVLDKLAKARRIKQLQLNYSRGWDETRDRKAGRFVVDWGRPESWRDAILQGPHLFVATPIYKAPNKTMLHNTDWSSVHLEDLAVDAVPVTAYKPGGNRQEYDRAYTHWDADPVRSAREFYRIAWRKMAANTGERTLIPALIPPGAAHVDGIFSAGHPTGKLEDLLIVQATLGSLVSDFLTRAVPKSDIRAASVERLPWPGSSSPLRDNAILRVLRLNCITSAYSQLWRSCYMESFQHDRWTGGFEHLRRAPIGRVGLDWTGDTPLRIAADRRQALLEIDALVSLMLGLTADELCTIYRTQFAVLHGYDRNVHVYDANGRLVPNSVLAMWRKKGDRITADERTATNQTGSTYTYKLPFVSLDREADMRQAYAYFERLLKERS
ncbi:DNA methyltransferase [Dactylosporangium sp. AC04546]|uniref:DNA methyltransferase n=1 Tax=Dactylosporangium sp. AC04546 TaxID=2862460 RepID=UPI001EDD9EF3|nr:DNA methyltransferase [Dactylosporangium sp. AC04546]WVK84187.1 DNA methyltransferase [Dactylosporangium sp. AC04546]